MTSYKDESDQALVVQFDTDVQNIAELLPIISLLFASSLDKVMMHDTRGEIIYLNPAMLNALSLQNFADIKRVAHLQAMKPYLQAVGICLETGQSSELALTVNHPQLNLEICEHIHFSVIKNKYCRIIGVMATSRNLSEYKQQHEEVKNRELYLRALLDSFPFIVWMKDRNGRFLTTNVQFAEVAGCQSSIQLEGKSDFDFFPADMAQGYVDDDSEVLLTGAGKSIDEQIQKSDGQVYWAQTYKSPVKVDGEVIGTVGFARDISEERRLHAEITTRNNEYIALVENIPMAIMVYDLHFRRVFVNKHYEYLIRQPSKSFIGKTPRECWSSSVINLSAEEYQDHLASVIKTGATVNFDMVYVQDESGVSTHNVKLIAKRNEHQHIIGVVALVVDVTEVSEYRKRIEHLAFYDTLTGLPNRTLFSQKLSKIITASGVNNTTFALMILDLDEFKAINDSMGHMVGDKLLKEVSARISSLGIDEPVIAGINPGNLFSARLGGDEFAILVEGLTKKSEVQTLANTLLQRITETYFIDQSEYFISASIGIAFYPEDSVDLDDLIKYADSAMYCAKREGRNHYQLYSPNLTLIAQKRLQIETELRHALDKQEMYLEYQPIVEIASQSIVGVECLCRWNSSQLGLVNPAEFIEVAEQTGLILPISKWIMREALRAARTINANRSNIITVSVNLSAKQFNDVNFIQHVVQLLEETHCKPSWIKFEITETLLLESKPLVVNALNAFDQLGIKISLDDFGTGQSALAYLQKFPIHQIKVDRSFIKEIDINHHSALLVKAIVALAESLNKELVAEGVETRQHASLLKSFGCKHAQGFLYSKSLGLERLLKFIEMPMT